MTISVYWKGMFATDRQITIQRNGEAIGKMSRSKIRTFDEHSPFLFNGHRIRAITIAGTTTELNNILVEVSSTDQGFHEKVGFDLLNYCVMRKRFEKLMEGGGKYDIITWILADKLYRVNWTAFTCRTYRDDGIDTTLFISEPNDVQLPFSTIKWCNSAEEIAWLYNAFSRGCGYGVDVLDVRTGEVTYHPYPTEAIRQRIRRTLLDNLDRFFCPPIPEDREELLVHEV